MLTALRNAIAGRIGKTERAALAGDPTFEAAFDLIRGDVPTRKPVQPPAAPLNDMEVFNQQLARLISAWNAAGADVRQHFVERYIDTPVMDRGAA